MEKDIFNEDDDVDVVTIDDEVTININRWEVENQIQIDVLNRRSTREPIEIASCLFYSFM